MTKEQEAIEYLKQFSELMKKWDATEISSNIETVLCILKEKDKQIDLMANFINDNTPYSKDTRELENEQGIRTAGFTKQYFERKSKE